MPKLVYHDSSGARGTVDMGSEPVIIGRANDCQIQTQDGLVSRRHAKVTFDGRYYWIEDNGSANGVYVGTERVQRHQLRGGDTFRCGHLEVRFDVDDLNRTGIGMMMSGNMVPLQPQVVQAVRAANAPIAPPPPVVAPPPPVVAPPPPVAAPPPPVAAPPVLSEQPTGPVRARPAPSASSNPPAAAMQMPISPMGPGDLTGRLAAAASGVRLPPPQMPAGVPASAPPPAPSLGFEGVPAVRPAQAGMPAAALGGSANSAELAALRSEVEAERRRRVEAEGERDVAQRRADEAQRKADDEKRRADEAQRKADELAAKPVDGETDRLRRRVEQLESELRRKGGGGGGGGSGASDALRAAETERDRLRVRVTEVEAELSRQAASAGGAAQNSAALDAEVRRLTAELEAERRRAAEAPKVGGEELERAKRRIEQLESEARRRPVGTVTDEKRAEGMRGELEAALRQLRDMERERDALREAVSRGAGGQAKPAQPVIDSLTVVSDGLADVRAALRAAGDDLALEQLNQIRNALRQACTQLGISL